MKNQKFTPLHEGMYDEFPDLSFYRTEAGDIYFDVTFYLKRLNAETCSWDDFVRRYAHQLNGLATVEHINTETMCLIDRSTGHLMADGRLSLLFVSYTNPAFLSYVLYSMHNMLYRGYCISDHALALLTQDRFGGGKLNGEDNDQKE